MLHIKESDSMKKQTSYYPKQSEVEHKWIEINAEGQTLGRLSSKVASILQGKHKPSYTPSVDMGDFVIIINAEKIKVTGNKANDKKYHSFSGYPGGLKTISFKHVLAKKPEQILIQSIKGMLPHNRIGRQMFKKLKVYAGNTHPHSAQNPQSLALNVKE